MRKDITVVINTVEVMIVLEVIVPSRWPLVALAYASPETMWLRVESAYISFTTSTPYQSSPWSMETTKVIQVGKPPSLRIMLWSLLPCCSFYIMIKAFHDFGWSNVTIGATSYFAAWLLMDESLYSQDFLGLSQWQSGIGRWHACIIILVNVFFYHSGLRWVRAC